MRFYLDTARMGQACPAALQVQCESARLAADDPSLYSLRFLKEGAAVWPIDVQQEFPILSQWQGIEALKRQFAAAFGLLDGTRIFLANQTARLVRISARVMFRQCTRVLTTDLNWPAWQSIVMDEGQQHGRQVVEAAIAKSVLNHGWTAGEIVEYLLRIYREKHCDGLFIPAVSSLGICLPIAALVGKLKQQAAVRFVLIDAAQAFCQIPDTGEAHCGDLLLTGCHKWLGAHLPMGVAVAGNSLAAEQFRCVCSGPRHSAACDDPLLQLTEQLQTALVNRYTETVNILPLLTAQAALDDGRHRRLTTDAQYRQRRLNAGLVADSLAASAWRPVRVDDTVHSAILLAQRAGGCTSEPEMLQSSFRQQGVALSAYPGGLLRLSLPSQNLTPDHVDQLAQAVQTVGRQF